MDANAPPPKSPLLQAQILVGALLMGVLTFSVIAVVMGMTMKPFAPDPRLGWLGAFIGMVSITARRFAVRGTTRAERARFLRQFPGADTAAETRFLLEAVFVKATIIATAPLEGAVFANLVCYLMAHQSISLAVAGILFAGMAMQFPTQARLDQWLNVQRGLLAQERQSAPAA